MIEVTISIIKTTWTLLREFGNFMDLTKLLSVVESGMDPKNQIAKLFGVCERVCKLGLGVIINN